LHFKNNPGLRISELRVNELWIRDARKEAKFADNRPPRTDNRNNERLNS
jgi:hypothetical protein